MVGISELLWTNDLGEPPGPSYSECVLQLPRPPLSLVCRCVEGTLHAFLVHKSLVQREKHPQSLFHVWARCDYEILDFKFPVMT